MSEVLGVVRFGLVYVWSQKLTSGCFSVLEVPILGITFGFILTFGELFDVPGRDPVPFRFFDLRSGTTLRSRLYEVIFEGRKTSNPCSGLNCNFDSNF